MCAVFVELSTDPFSAIMDNFVDLKRRTGAGAGVKNVRRPFRGLEIKEDTYADIRVVDALNRNIPLINSSDNTSIDEETGRAMSMHYTNFVLQSVSEQRAEKMQIVDTFGDPYIYFFGEQPRFLECQAILVNSNDFNWEAEFWENYNLYLRGTKCAEIGARVYLFYDDNIVEGYMVQAEASKNSQLPMAVNLVFRLFVTRFHNVSFIGDPFYPIRDEATLIGEDLAYVNVSMEQLLVDLERTKEDIQFNQEAYGTSLDMWQQKHAPKTWGPITYGGSDGSGSDAPVNLLGWKPFGNGTPPDPKPDYTWNSITRMVLARREFVFNIDEYTAPELLPTAVQDVFDKLQEIENLQLEFERGLRGHGGLGGMSIAEAWGKAKKAYQTGKEVYDAVDGGFDEAIKKGWDKAKEKYKGAKAIADAYGIAKGLGSKESNDKIWAQIKPGLNKEWEKIKNKKPSKDEQNPDVFSNTVEDGWLHDLIPEWEEHWPDNKEESPDVTKETP